MDILFSVIVCTFNRANMLRDCINSLCNQSLDKRLYEVIIVDNNSTDNTRKVVEEFLSERIIKYVFEEKLGLSNARNRGLLESRGQYIAYIDDDARAAVNWLEVAHSLLSVLSYNLDCLGGPCYPFYLSKKPDWFKDSYETRKTSEEQKFISKGDHISGSNMIWARQSLSDIQGFNVQTGVIGEKLVLGEESLALEKLWQIRKEAKVFYSPNLLVYHWVPDFKMTVVYRLKRRFAEGQYNAYSTTVQKRNRLVFLTKLLFNLLKAFLRLILRLKSHPYWQNWIVEDGARISSYLGTIFGLIGIKLKISGR